jgi:hypothetical protein
MTSEESKCVVKAPIDKREVDDRMRCLIDALGDVLVNDILFIIRDYSKPFYVCTFLLGS